MNEKVLGPESCATAESLENLAFILLFLKKDYDVAESIMIRAPAIYEKLLVPVHRDTDRARIGLAVMTVRPLIRISWQDKKFGVDY